MNWTESDIAEHYSRLGMKSPDFASVATEKAPRSKTPAKPKPLEGHVSEFMVLYGHCPSKKNLWRRAAGESGGMFLDSEVRAQIDTLTTQAVFHWQHLGRPVEHPEITVKFFVCAQRQDRDGMFTTILDCLQAAGVLVNDNIARNNGRTVLEPCEFVKPEKERVEISIEKR